MLTALISIDLIHNNCQFYIHVLSLFTLYNAKNALNTEDIGFYYITVRGNFVW